MQLSSMLVPLQFSCAKLAACLELAAACPACPAPESLCRTNWGVGALLPLDAAWRGAGQCCSPGGVWWRDAELVRSCLTSYFLESANYQIKFHGNALVWEIFILNHPRGSSRSQTCTVSEVFHFYLSRVKCSVFLDDFPFQLLMC